MRDSCRPPQPVENLVPVRIHRVLVSQKFTMGFDELVLGTSPLVIFLSNLNMHSQLIPMTERERLAPSCGASFGSRYEINYVNKISCWCGR